jgi:5'-nucleotidase
MLKILITNDDGIHALGIKRLVESLRGRAKIYVSAPSEERSAVGHGITVRTPLRVESIDFHGYSDITAWSINGNPADCVKMAILALMDEKPDLILSGINAGINLGKDIYYSGTVSAAREGVILGIPSIALSYDNHFHPYNFGEVDTMIAQLFKTIDPGEIPKDVLLNINLPHRKLKEVEGVLPVPLDLHHYSDDMRLKEGEGGGEYWLERKYNIEQMYHYDYHMLKAGYITVTPIHIDSTDLSFLSTLKSWNWKV